MKVELTYLQDGKTWRETVPANSNIDPIKIGEADNTPIKIKAAGYYLLVQHLDSNNLFPILLLLFFRFLLNTSVKSVLIY